jgi:hypothetical protein
MVPAERGCAGARGAVSRLVDAQEHHFVTRDAPPGQAGKTSRESTQLDTDVPPSPRHANKDTQDEQDCRNSLLP